MRPLRANTHARRLVQRPSAARCQPQRQLPFWLPGAAIIAAAAPSASTAPYWSRRCCWRLCWPGWCTASG